MTLSAAAAAPTNLMLHLIKTTKDEPRMPDTALLHLAFIRLHLFTSALSLFAQALPFSPSRAVSFPRFNHQC